MENTSISLLSELQERIGKRNRKTISKKVFVGFDGFVDKIKKAVKQRRTSNTIFYKSLHEFADRISAASGKSGQIEMSTKKIKLGGNAPILADTLGRLGVSGFCLGSMGYPKKNKVFASIDSKFEVISLLEPGLSDAIEFEDGKMIFSELEVFDHYDWKYIRKTVELKKLKAVISQSTVLAFVDWVNLPHASDIWQGILHDVVKKSGRTDFIFLFDLCDPSKKTTAQIDEVLDLMSSFSAYGKVTLGLNENETFKIWSAINGVDFNDPRYQEKLPTIYDAGAAVYQAMTIDRLLIHPIDRTIVFKSDGMVQMKGRLVTKPKVLTGGGDNLNAGYVLGLLLDLPLSQCMVLGMAASGSYIENGSSPDLKDIISYIDVWKNDLSHEHEHSKHVFVHRHE